ncbi:MAG: family 20 glycosylhydrolase [Sediminibacterium sp.]
MILKFLPCIAFLLFTQTAVAQVAIIPEPVSIVNKTGHFKPGKQISISANTEKAEVQHIARLLSNKLAHAGLNSSISSNAHTATINLILHSAPDKNLGKEGYQLKVIPLQGISISANEAAGLFYGIQTLLQLLPEQVETKDGLKNQPVSIPAVEITDYPRFSWRGLMFDVSRHFFTKQEVKDFIDQMVKYKYNLLHLHLTDDEGWRLEIKSLPKLTSVGAWRVNKTGSFGTFSVPDEKEPKDYGGFYTQDDIRDLVQYAKERYVNILPEIDVPGHSLAAIASYPELSCTPGAENYRVRSGEKIMEWPPKGHFYGLLDNTLCPANEKVYEFLDKVFTEVAQLFPFEYIHMGGDETARNFWEKTPAIKELMKNEQLSNLDEVQSYFVKRVGKILKSKGKKLIGWDEILEGGLAPDAAVMSWRGMKGGIEAAKAGHEVIMSPSTFAYLDYMQGDKIAEPPVYASLRLNKTYQFDPLPEGVDPKLIKGGQANVWTEQIYNTRHLQYMLWPRGFAIAESVWSPKEKKEWKLFVPKVETHFKRLDAAGIKYAPSIYDPSFSAAKNTNNEWLVTLAAEIDGLTIHYSFDNSFPDQYYPQYSAPLVIPKDAKLMRVVTYRNGKQAGRILSIPVEDLKTRKAI